jgi:hypothetical protein
MKGDDVKTVHCQEIALKYWKVKMNIKALTIFHGASQNQDNFDKSIQYAGYAKSFIGGLTKVPLRTVFGNSIANKKFRGTQYARSNLCNS